MAHCGHTTAGSCAEAFLPVGGQPAWCVSCQEGSWLIDVIDTRPLRDSRGFS